MEMVTFDTGDLAGVQYHGLAGATRECLDSTKRLIHYGDKIHEAKLLTYKDGGSTHHAFILNINYDEIIAVKSGFSSGYSGTGSRGLAKTLQLLIRHEVNVSEYEVEKELVERLDKSCLLQADLNNIEKLAPVRPDRYLDYIFALYPRAGRCLYDDEELRREFPTAMPFGLIDTRLVDLAIGFFDDPDACLMTAFRRLEDIVKKRANIKGKSGSRLFSQAFQGDESALYWEDEDKNEHASKANMFSAVYGAYRNPRAHRESRAQDKECLQEFLLINELYFLESAAVDRPIGDSMKQKN